MFIYALYELSLLLKAGLLIIIFFTKSDLLVF